MTLDPDNMAGISVAALARIDEVCLDFEKAWRSGVVPNVEMYLDCVSPEIRPALISELLLLDIDYRQRRGENPRQADYSSRLPNDVSAIKSVFGHLQEFNKPGETPPPGMSVTATDSAPNQEPPQQLGRYRIIRKLGAGGFSSVYLATDDELQRNVAIKIPHWNRQAERFDASRFLEEARIVATLSHPAIVPVFDVGHLDNAPPICFVVSQLMDGGDLGEYLAAHRLPMDESVHIVARLADALHYAHGRGLVHRDIKTSNILRDSNGEVFVADFGLALRDTDLGGGTGFVGTPAYMSPEQARGEGHLVDGRTDIYSLGVILYELLTGVRPFQSSSITKLLEQVQQREPKPPRQINDLIPVELERICLKSLAKRPGDRYSTASDLAIDLRAWQKASAPGGGAGISPGRLRRQMIAGLIAVIFLGIVGVIALRTNPARSPAAIESLAVLPFRPLNMADDDEYLGLGISDALITKLANIRRLKVRPTGSILHYAESNTESVASGRELGVDAVLEGTIQRTVKTIRASVRLLRVSDGSTLWAGTFNEDSNDLFVVQDVIAEKVMRVLALKLSSEEQTRFDRRHTDSPAAQESYLKGRYHWNQRASTGGVDLAIKFYKQAIDQDPLFALAYAGLAESYVVMNVYNFHQTEAAFPMGKAAAEQALRLDPGLTEAVTTLAYVKFYYDYDWEGAEKEFLRAIELNPNYATAHQWYGEFLYFMKRFDESIVEIELAGELDPLSSIIRSIRGSPYLFRRDYGQAREEFLNALSQHPDSGVALYGLATSYEQQKDFENAIQAYNQLHAPPNRISPAGKAGLGYVYAISGQEAEARTILEELVNFRRPQHVSPYLIATVHAGLGDQVEALVWLHMAFDERDDRITWLAVDPKMDSLRSDRRFIEFLGEIGMVD